MIHHNIREIRFNGKSSLIDYGLLIGSEFDTDTRVVKAKPRTLRETVPFMNGSHDFTKMGGRIIYGDRPIYYTFIISEASKEAVEEKARMIDEWLSGDADTELYDSVFPGWHFTNVTLQDLGELQYYSYNENKARLTAEFIAGPFMYSDGLLINCCTFTLRDSRPYDLFFDSDYRLFTRYSDMYYLSSMSVGNIRVEAERFDTSCRITAYVAAEDEDISRDHPRWCGVPAYFHSDIYGDMELNITNTDQNCTVIGKNSKYIYLMIESWSITFMAAGTDQNGDIGADRLSGWISGSEWLTPYGAPAAFGSDMIPDLDNMRIISEGEPALYLDGKAADISNFALTAPVLMELAGAKDEQCVLQYCTVKERL